MDTLTSILPELTFYEASESQQKAKDPKVENKIEKKTSEELSISEVLHESEKIPVKILEEYGPDVAEKIFKGSGNPILLVKDDLSLTYIPNTDTVIFNNENMEKRLISEVYLRQPGKIFPNNADSFLSVELTQNFPDSDRSSGAVDTHDLKEISYMGDALKDSEISTEGVIEEKLDEKGKVVMKDGKVLYNIKDPKMYNQISSLVAAGLARRSTYEKGSIKDISPPERLSLYNEMYHGPKAGEDLTGVSIMHEGLLENTPDPENVLETRNYGIEAKLVEVEESLLEKKHGEPSLAEKYIRPNINNINKQIDYLNEKIGRELYKKVDDQNIVSTLLYKIPENLDGKRVRLDGNFFPVILSDEVQIYEGYRDKDSVDTIVIMKRDGKWEAMVFDGSDDKRDPLDYRISNWV